jgi:ankyrin repeat protein
MKIKNLLLLFILLNGFSARPSFGAGAPEVEDAGREVAGAEEHKGPDEEDAAPAGAGTGAVAGGAEGAAAGVVGGAEEAPVVVSQGALAKIDQLLRGSLTGVPKAMQGASLLHGAMLWEMGIVKMLYALLVTPKKVEVGGQARLEPDAENTQFPLGKALIEFFRLTGEAFKPSSAETVVSVHLTPEKLGQLYKVLINGGEIPEPFESRPKKVRFTRIKEYKDALNSCKVNALLNPKNLLPSIIMAFFWAKFVMGITLLRVPTLAEARENIKIFMQSAQVGLSDVSSLASAASAGGAVLDAGATVVEGAVAPLNESQDLAVVEAEVIARIIAMYQYKIPKPPLQGNAIIQPLPGTGKLRTFPDCGESGMRGLFLAAFYDRKNKQFVVPSASACVYSTELKNYFQTFPTVDNQVDDEARNAWGKLCSDRPELIYSGSFLNCDLACSFQNVMSLLGILVPGAVPMDCNCSKEASGLPAVGGAGAAAGGGVPSPKKPLHKKTCAQKILHNFCSLPGHDLEVSELLVGSQTSWKITSKKDGDKNCHLFFNTDLGHMSCELRIQAGAAGRTMRQIKDPILGGSDAISVIPKDPDLVEPLVFAASRMAQQGNFTDGYVFMYEDLTEAQRKQLVFNINSWNFMLPEQKTILKGIKDETILFYAAERGYCELIAKKIKAGADVKAKNPFDATVFTLAATKGHVEVVRLLLERHAFDVNDVDGNDNTALILASASGHAEIVRLLLDHSAKVDAKNRYRDTACVLAASNGHIEVLKLLFERHAVDVNDVAGNDDTALILASANGHTEIVRLLLDRSAKVNAKNRYGDTAWALASTNGHIEVLKLLLEREAVDVKRINCERYLIWAAETGNTDFVRLLLDSGAAYNPDLIEKFPHFSTWPEDVRASVASAILRSAARYGHTDLVKLFLDSALIEVNAADNNGYTALIWASTNNHPNIVRLLLDAGAVYNPHLIKRFPHFSTWPEDVRARIESAIPKPAWRRALAKIKNVHQKVTDAFKAYSEAVHPHVP